MIFSKDITTIFITRRHIRAAVFSTKGRAKTEVQTYVWDKENIDVVLKEIFSNGPKEVRVVFGEEFSYVTAVPIGKKNREEIRRSAQEIIPEKLENNWDFKKEKSSETQFQVAAIKPEIFEFFQKKFKESGLKIEAIEPQSVSLARVLPERGLALFMCEDDDKILLGAVSDSTLETAQITSEGNVTADFRRFREYVKKKFSKDPSVVFVGPKMNMSAGTFVDKDIEIRSFNPDPLRAVAIKENISGADWQVMNIDPENISITPEKEISGESNFSKREIILAIIFIGGLLAAGAFIYWKKFH